MNKQLYGLAALISVAALGWYFFLYNPCQPAPAEVLSTVKMNCVLKTIMGALAQPEQAQQDFCKSLGRDKDCHLTEEDRPAVESFLDNQVMSCIKEELKKNNFCTDKLPSLRD